VVAGLNQTLHDIALESDGTSLPFAVGGLVRSSGLRVLNEPSPEVAGLEVCLWIQGVDNPTSVACPAGGHIEPLLEHLLVTKVEDFACWGIQNGQENYISPRISFIIARTCHTANDAVRTVGSKVRSQEAVDFQRLALLH